MSQGLHLFAETHNIFHPVILLEQYKYKCHFLSIFYPLPITRQDAIIINSLFYFHCGLIVKQKSFKSLF